jgi:hypothetical protein
MGNCTLRSRTADLNQDGVEFTARESNSDPRSDQPKVLGSAEEQPEGLKVIMWQVPESETLNLEVTETNLGQQHCQSYVGSSPENSMADPNDLRKLFANMLSAIQGSNRQMQESNDKLRISLKKATRRSKKCSSRHKGETEKLIKRFKMENQRLSKLAAVKKIYK